MNKIGTFISGAVVGSVVTYIIMYHKTRKLENMTQEEINSIKRDYTWKKDDNYISDILKDHEDEDDDSEESESDTDDNDKEDRKHMYNYASRSEKLLKRNRHKDEEKKIFRSVKNQDYLDDMIDEEDEDDYADDPYLDDEGVLSTDGDGGDDLVTESPTEGMRDAPYSIRPHIFANTCLHYDKCSLIWYAVDDVLADEEKERIVDFNIVGNDWRDHVGDYEEDVAYIRNESISVDYEIVKENLSFFKDAL